MVFEHLFPEQLLERKAWTAFALAFIYSTISIIIARLLFPANSGLVSVVFVSIFLIPYFSTILKREELQEESESKKQFFGILRDNVGVIRVYLAIFLGIYLTYVLYSFLAPVLGYDVGKVFREQLSLEVVRGGATFSVETFGEILLNNWWVLLACFVVALLAGDGAIFFVAWNASTWGTIFGYRAVAAGSYDHSSALVALLIILLITLPHLLLEGGAYILAAISGGIMSDLVDQVDEVRGFVVYFIASGLCFWLLYVILRSVLGSSALLLGCAAALIVLGLLHCMPLLLSGAKDRAVFRYNYYVFLVALGVFVLGALVETLVLYNSTLLNSVYARAMMGG